MIKNRPTLLARKAAEAAPGPAEAREQGGAARKDMMKPLGTDEGGYSPYVHYPKLLSLSSPLFKTPPLPGAPETKLEGTLPKGLDRLVGSSPAMSRVRDLIFKARLSAGTVLITGETGTGKELVARALHDVSACAAQSFVEVNCAALTETLVESELFGHERGAFTGAVSKHRGKFEQAHRGTVFLDEIGDVPMAVQAKLLRVLQEHCFQRVGGEQSINVDVRVICATNHNLEAATAAGAFRKDLLYRINMLVIEIPPLRERKADVPELARHFLERGAASGNFRARGISETALRALQSHHWPGNVRELQNAIEHALIFCDEEQIESYHLPPAVMANEPLNFIPERDKRSVGNKGLIDVVAGFERVMILRALQRHAGNKSRAARTLQITRRMLSYKMTKLGIDDAGN